MKVSNAIPLMDLLNTNIPISACAQNAANAQTNIYACAYVQTKDGFTFGLPVARSLQQQLQDIDAMWDDLTEAQQTSLNQLYETYQKTMSLWGMSNIGKAKVAQ